MSKMHHSKTMLNVGARVIGLSKSGLSLAWKLAEEYSLLRAWELSSGGAPTPAGTSVFSKHNWDMGMHRVFVA